MATTSWDRLSTVVTATLLVPGLVWWHIGHLGILLHRHLTQRASQRSLKPSIPTLRITGHIRVWTDPGAVQFDIWRPRASQLQSARAGPRQATLSGLPRWLAAHNATQPPLEEVLRGLLPVLPQSSSSDLLHIFAKRLMTDYVVRIPRQR